MAHRHEHADWHFSDRRKNMTLLGIGLVVEVDPLIDGQRPDRGSQVGQMARFSHHARHEVPTATHGLVDERVGEGQPLQTSILRSSCYMVSTDYPVD